MKFIHQTVRAGIAALVIGAIAPASAQVVAASTLGLAGYQLIDLDTSDGITPWIHFQEWQIQSLAGLYDPLNNQIEETGSTQFGSIGVVNADGYARATLAPEQVETSILAYGGVSSAFANNRHFFELSPNTAVRFVATGHLLVGGPEWGSGNAGVVLASSVDGTGGAPSENIAHGVIDQDVNMDNDVSYYGTVPGAGWVDLMTSSYVSAFAPPVPEPASGAMLMSGLGLVAALLRKRRRGG